MLVTFHSRGGDITSNELSLIMDFGTYYLKNPQRDTRVIIYQEQKDGSTKLNFSTNHEDDIDYIIIKYHRELDNDGNVDMIKSKFQFVASDYSTIDFDLLELSKYLFMNFKFVFNIRDPELKKFALILLNYWNLTLICDVGNKQRITFAHIDKYEDDIRELPTINYPVLSMEQLLNYINYYPKLLVESIVNRQQSLIIDDSNVDEYETMMRNMVFDINKINYKKLLTKYSYYCGHCDRPIIDIPFVKNGLMLLRMEGIRLKN